MELNLLKALDTLQNNIYIENLKKTTDIYDW